MAFPIKKIANFFLYDCMYNTTNMTSHIEINNQFFDDICAINKFDDTPIKKLCNYYMSLVKDIEFIDDIKNKYISKINIILQVINASHNIDIQDDDENLEENNSNDINKKLIINEEDKVVDVQENIIVDKEDKVINPPNDVHKNIITNEVHKEETDIKVEKQKKIVKKVIKKKIEKNPEKQKNIITSNDTIECDKSEKSKETENKKPKRVVRKKEAKPKNE